jgi:hypothetical protein
MGDDAGWNFGVDETHGDTATRQTVCVECGWPLSSCACDAPSVSGGFRQPRPPLRWLLVALVASVVGGAIAGVGGGLVMLAFLGWVLAGPVAVLAFGTFLRRTTVVSSMSGYGEPSWLPAARKVLPVLVLVAVALASWRIADWASRL